MIRAKVSIAKGSSAATQEAARAAAAQAIAIVKQVAADCGFEQDVVIHMQERRSPTVAKAAEPAADAWPSGDLAKSSTWGAR